MGGKIVDLIRYPNEKEPQWGATNASIGHNGKSLYAVTLRSSNYIIDDQGDYKVTTGGYIKNRVYFSELDKDLKLKRLRKIDFDGLNVVFNRGVEDAKLFYRDGWYFTCVVLEREHTPMARMGICKLNTRTNKVTDFQVFPGQKPDRPEKNWMIPPKPSAHFDWIYGANRVLIGETLNIWMTDHAQVDQLRGSSNLLQDPENEDGYIAVMHRTFFTETNPYVGTTFGTKRIQRRNYVHYFVRFDKYGYITELTDGFQFYKPGVEFAAGMAFRGNETLISFGRNDVSSHIAILPTPKVLESFKAVEY